MHDGFKVTESVCISKFEQQCVIAIMKIFENEPESRWLDEKIFFYYMSVLFLTNLMIAVPFVKGQAILCPTYCA